MPFKLSLEKRVEDVPKWMPAATSIGAVVLAFIISGIILKIIGGQPLLVGRYFYEATFGSWAVISDTLVKATPLILTASPYGRLYHETVEYWRGRTVLHGRICRQPCRACSTCPP